MIILLILLDKYYIEIVFLVNICLFWISHFHTSWDGSNKWLGKSWNVGSISQINRFTGHRWFSFTIGYERNILEKAQNQLKSVLVMKMKWNVMKCNVMKKHYHYHRTTPQHSCLWIECWFRYRVFRPGPISRRVPSCICVKLFSIVHRRTLETCFNAACECNLDKLYLCCVKRSCWSLCGMCFLILIFFFLPSMDPLSYNAVTSLKPQRPHYRL